MSYQIIIPDLGYYNSVPVEQIPLVEAGPNTYRTGWADVRNMMLSRRPGTVKKGYSASLFTTYATAESRVMGLGVLNKYGRPTSYEAGANYIRAASAAGSDTGKVYGSTLDASAATIMVGVSAGVTYEAFVRIPAITIPKSTVIQSAYLWLSWVRFWNR